MESSFLFKHTYTYSTQRHANTTGQTNHLILRMTSDTPSSYGYELNESLTCSSLHPDEIPRALPNHHPLKLKLLHPQLLQHIPHQITRSPRITKRITGHPTGKENATEIQEIYPIQDQRNPDGHRGSYTLATSVVYFIIVLCVLLIINMDGIPKESFLRKVKIPRECEPE